MSPQQQLTSEEAAALLLKLDRNVTAIIAILDGGRNLDGSLNPDAPGMRARLRRLEDVTLPELKKDMQPCVNFFRDPKKVQELDELLELRRSYRTGMKWLGVGLLLNIAGLGAVGAAILRMLGGG